MSLRLVIPAVVAVAFLADARAASPAAGQSAAIRVIVAFEPPVPGSRELLSAMMREADAIWRPYGVILVWRAGAAGESSSGPAALLRVRFAHGGGPARAIVGPGMSRLGAIQFVDGAAAEDIMLSADEIAATVMSTQLTGHDLRQMPPTFVENVTGRATGRVLAHELGHYLLGLPTHTRKGLMRPSFSGRELVDWDRRAFGLDAAARLRLRARAADNLQIASWTSAEARD